MLKKITGGILSLLAAGGLFFGMAGNTCLASAVTSDALISGERISNTIVLKSAAEVFGITTQQLINSLRSSRIGGFRELLNSNDMTIREFIPALRERITANLKLLIGRDKPAESSTIQTYLSNFIAALQQRPALAFAIANRMLAAMAGKIAVPSLM